MPTLSTAAIVTRLQEVRTTRVRAPVEVLALGKELVERGWMINSHSSTSSHDVQEQVAFAAIELGNLDLAQALVDRLANDFSRDSSQRVVALDGALLEAHGRLDDALALYQTRLALREHDVLIRKRLIALHLSTPLSRRSNLSRQEGIRLLVEYLDTTYVDAEAWCVLSKEYAQLGRYDQSLSALDHAVLLQPQNPFLLLRHAELALTVGLCDVALKESLRVVEMSTTLEQPPATTTTTTRRLQGCGQRAAFTAKSCITRLLQQETARVPPPRPSKSGGSDSVSDDKDGGDVTTTRPSRDKLEQLDLVVTRLILESYNTNNNNNNNNDDDEDKMGQLRTTTTGTEGRRRVVGEELRAVREWLGASA